MKNDECLTNELFIINDMPKVPVTIFYIMFRDPAKRDIH